VSEYIWTKRQKRDAARAIRRSLREDPSADNLTDAVMDAACIHDVYEARELVRELT
jgi:hypothetical protein